MNAPWDDRGDRRFLRRMADGDREALAELYDRHAAALFVHAVAPTRSPADAEDLVQGVFVKVAGMGARLLGSRSAGAYLHGMLRAAFLDGERHRGVAAEEPLSGLGGGARRPIAGVTLTRERQASGNRSNAPYRQSGLMSALPVSK